MDDGKQVYVGETGPRKPQRILPAYNFYGAVWLRFDSVMVHGGTPYETPSLHCGRSGTGFHLRL